MLVNLFKPTCTSFSHSSVSYRFISLTESSWEVVRVVWTCLCINTFQFDVKVTSADHDMAQLPVLSVIKDFYLFKSFSSSVDPSIEALHCCLKLFSKEMPISTCSCLKHILWWKGKWPLKKFELNWISWVGVRLAFQLRDWLLVIQSQIQIRTLQRIAPNSGGKIWWILVQTTATPFYPEEACSLVTRSLFKTSSAAVSSQCGVCVGEGCFPVVVSCSLWKLLLTRVLPPCQTADPPGVGSVMDLQRGSLGREWTRRPQGRWSWHTVSWAVSKSIHLPFFKRRGGWLRGCLVFLLWLFQHIFLLTPNVF